jgi:hypothetical protein
MSLVGLEISFTQFRLVPDGTGCRHWAHSGTTKYERCEIGWCPHCHKEFANMLDEAGQRTGETMLVSYS